jgi:signal transduction histidine kinase
VAEEHGLQLEVGRLDEVTVSGNRHHLRQVLNNLLDNAIKFTSVAVAGGDPALLPLEERMKIRVELARNDEAKTASLIVVDHGIGMEAKYLPQIFDRFFRADPARQRELGQTGTGLGLSICKAIAEAHGGQIEADSLPGRGMTMRVTLPML